MSSSGEIFVRKLLLQNLIRFPNDVLLQYQSPPPPYFILAILNELCPINSEQLAIRKKYAKKNDFVMENFPKVLNFREVKLAKFSIIINLFSDSSKLIENI
jgi:hypothetical protein